MYDAYQRGNERSSGRTIFSILFSPYKCNAYHTFITTIDTVADLHV